MIGRIKTETSGTLRTSVFSKGKRKKTGEKATSQLTVGGGGHDTGGGHGHDIMGFRNLKASQDDMINMEFGCQAPHLKLSEG